jgi:uncharacterized protein YegP (UPF0339 family)
MHQFRIVRSEGGQYRVYFERAGAVLVRSASLPTRASAKTCIAAIKLNVARAEVVDHSESDTPAGRGFRFEIVRAADDGQGYFVQLWAGEQLMVRSENYTVKRSAEGCIASVRSNGPMAETVDETAGS